ncbi:hypothetical protein [Pseudonocardia sp.]|nr:hypothetical protein [Pseudonocardia sp.]
MPRTRSRCGATVAAPAALRDDLAAALVSGRMDHVLLTEEER